MFTIFKYFLDAILLKFGCVIPLGFFLCVGNCQLFGQQPNVNADPTKVLAHVMVLDEVTYSSSGDGFLAEPIMLPGQSAGKGAAIFELDSNEIRLEIKNLEYDSEALKVAAENESEIVSTWNKLESEKLYLKDITKLVQSGRITRNELELFRANASVQGLEAKWKGATRKFNVGTF